jgi:hypothetical protein
MKATALLVVFLAAKSAVLCGHAAPLSVWSAAAYARQDVLVALAFAAVDGALRKVRASPRVAGALYAALSLYAAANIPVGRVVSTPLTWPMLRAARGPLADSILLYVTPSNCLLVLSVLALAAALPRLLPLTPRPLQYLAAACVASVVLFGPFAQARVETRGMERNVLTALIDTGLPRVNTHPVSAGWRASRFAEASPQPEDLISLEGIARGHNVIMVSLESTAAQYLALYGSQYEPMPNLTALAQHALVFDNAYAVYPESIKGLFSVLCSVFPAFDSRPEEYERVSCRSVAQALAGAGYRTAMFHSGRFAYLGMESVIRNRGYQTLEDAGDIGGNHRSSFGVDEPATVARMLSWIDALPRGQRFFLTYLPIAGHHPYAVPERGPFAGSQDIDQYRNALHYGDASLGAFAEGLRERGLDQNTIWVIYGDHGEAFYQHPGNYGHTFFLYEENVHVPFLIVAPGLIPAQRRVRKVVSLVDAAPTILDLMGIPPPPQYQGRTMLDAVPRMALFFADYSLGLLGLRDGLWKFTYEIGSGRTQLFDLARDPRELSDASKREPDRAEWYGQIVRGWSNDQKTYLAQSAVPK